MCKRLQSAKQRDSNGSLWEEVYEMVELGTPALAAAAVCFAIFFGNVAMGAAGVGVFMGDVAEMLSLVAASVFFVVGVLAREASARQDRE